MTVARPLAARLTASILVACALLASALVTSLGTATAQAASTARYIITVTHFKAVEESGNAWFGSDEVYGSFRVLDPRTQVDMAGFRSQLIKGFDSGETKALDPERNCLPHRQLLVRVSTHPFLDARAGDRWLCNPPNTAIGLPGPFVVTAWLWEQESCALDCTGQRPFIFAPWLASDEKLGRADRTFSEQSLATDLPTVGSSRNYTLQHRDSGAAYNSTLNIKRVA